MKKSNLFSHKTPQTRHPSSWIHLGHKIIELKGNFIPKGLVPLERIFSKDDTPLKLAMQSSEENVVNCNIRTEEQPRMVKISKNI